VNPATLGRSAGGHHGYHILDLAGDAASREATEAAGVNAAAMGRSAAGQEAGLAAGMSAGALSEPAAGDQAGRPAGLDAAAEGVGSAAGEERPAGLDAPALGRGAAGEELSGLHDQAAAAALERITGQEAAALRDAAGDRPGRGRLHSATTAAALDTAALSHRTHAHTTAHSTTAALGPAGLNARTNRRFAGRWHLTEMLGQRTLYKPREAHCLALPVVTVLRGLSLGIGDSLVVGARVYLGIFSTAGAATFRTGVWGTAASRTPVLHEVGDGQRVLNAIRKTAVKQASGSLVPEMPSPREHHRHPRLIGGVASASSRLFHDNSLPCKAWKPPKTPGPPSIE
jgi:hypothetical protein